MIDDTGGDRRSSDAEDDAPFLPTPDELAELEAVDLAGHAVAVLAELKERGMLRVLLRNRVDLATLFEADEVRFADGAVEVVAAGFHAETPDAYGEWLREADALHERLADPATGAEEAEALVRRASSEALLLELDRAEDADAEASAERGNGLNGVAVAGPAAGGAAGPATRIADELKRRGAIEERAEY
jgi:hypothetical protein